MPWFVFIFVVCRFSLFKEKSTYNFVFAGHLFVFCPAQYTMVKLMKMMSNLINNAKMENAYSLC